MKEWRIYRVPGSREFWHIDSGPGTHVVSVKDFECKVNSKSVDVGGNNHPRAWISICAWNTDLHIIGWKAIFSFNKDGQKCACEIESITVQSSTSNILLPSAEHVVQPEAEGAGE